VLDGLQAADIQFWVHDQVESNPTTDNIDSGLALLREHGCSLLVAMGGGSAIDCAKGIALLASNGGAVRDYTGVGRYAVNPLPVIAVPTTVGTGSEVTAGAVITDKSAGEKLIFGGAEVQPKLAVLDPRAVETLPARVAAGSGVDALTHALEAYVSTRASPFSDEINRAALRLVGQYLRPAVAGDAEALGRMQVAACMAGLGMSGVGLGLVHALANVAGGFFNTHHGTTNGVFLPYVMEYNLAAQPAKFADIARALGEDVDGQDLHTAAQRSVEAVRRLIADIGLPSRARDLGISSDRIPDMARLVLTHIDAPTNPRAYPYEAVVQLYEEAI
jgi:alcohol dehydrogenase class IV